MATHDCEVLTPVVQSSTCHEDSDGVGEARYYRQPELYELGTLAAVQGTSYGNTYDGSYTTRSWYYTR